MEEESTLSSGDSTREATVIVRKRRSSVFRKEVKVERAFRNVLKLYEKAHWTTVQRIYDILSLKIWHVIHTVHEISTGLVARERSSNAEAKLDQVTRTAEFVQHVPVISALGLGLVGSGMSVGADLLKEKLNRHHVRHLKKTSNVLYRKDNGWIVCSYVTSLLYALTSRLEIIRTVPVALLTDLFQEQFVDQVIKIRKMSKLGGRDIGRTLGGNVIKICNNKGWEGFQRKSRKCVIL
jgi:hypothetical protein